MKNYTVFDAHCDTLCKLLDNGGSIIENRYNADKTRMLEYSGYTQVFACYISPKYVNTAMDRFNQLYTVYKNQDFSGITPILSVEGAYMINSLEDVDYLIECGVKCIALTWNNSNKIAGGADDENTGLSEFGKAVVRKFNENKVMIDVSHLNDKSFYDVSKITTMPLIATHSNSRSICNHRRNLDDEMFKIIRDSGGVAGLNLYPEFVKENGRCNVGDCISHLEHFMELDGEDAIGIGADFDGTDNSFPDGISGCEDIHKIFEEMEKRGFGKSETEKISHKNFERIFGEHSC